VDALLAEIFAAAAADGDSVDEKARLVYADWLQQRGDPLGRFIALQCARAVAVPPSYELRQEEQALLDAHWREWLGAPAGAFDRYQVSFARGFWTQTGKLFSNHAIAAAKHARDPAWGTVRSLNIDYRVEATPVWRLLEGPLQASLRELLLGDVTLAADVAERGQLALRRLRCELDPRTRELPPSLITFPALPQLAQLSVLTEGPFVAALTDTLAAGPGGPSGRVSHLELLVGLEQDPYALTLGGKCRSTALERVSVLYDGCMHHFDRGTDGKLSAVRIKRHVMPFSPLLEHDLVELGRAVDRHAPGSFTELRVEVARPLPTAPPAPDLTSFTARIESVGGTVVFVEQTPDAGMTPSK
jgi:uncharacterized protein (TIGR02996 family)